jgi:hypothetical protein
MRGSLKVEGYGCDIKESQGFSVKQPTASGWTGLGAICAVEFQIERRARSWTGAVDQVHWSMMDQAKGGFALF